MAFMHEEPDTGVGPRPASEYAAKLLANNFRRSRADLARERERAVAAWHDDDWEQAWSFVLRWEPRPDGAAGVYGRAETPLAWVAEGHLEDWRASGAMSVAGQAAFSRAMRAALGAIDAAILAAGG